MNPVSHGNLPETSAVTPIVALDVPDRAGAQRIVEGLGETRKCRVQCHRDVCSIGALASQHV